MPTDRRVPDPCQPRQQLHVQVPDHGVHLGRVDFGSAGALVAADLARAEHGQPPQRGAEPVGEACLSPRVSQAAHLRGREASPTMVRVAEGGNKAARPRDLRGTDSLRGWSGFSGPLVRSSARRWVTPWAAPSSSVPRERSPHGFPRLVPVARCAEAAAGTPARPLTTRRWLSWSGVAAGAGRTGSAGHLRPLPAVGSLRSRSTAGVLGSIVDDKLELGEGQQTGGGVVVRNTERNRGARGNEDAMVLDVVLATGRRRAVLGRRGVVGVGR